MSKSKTKTNARVPSVEAYAPGPAILRKRPHLAKSWLAPCPFCDRVHIHGVGEGARLSHCPATDGPHGFEFEGRQRPDAYQLVYAGVLDDADLFKTESRLLREKYKRHCKARTERHAARLATISREAKSTSAQERSA